jgi:putative flippase GtrA
MKPRRDAIELRRFVVYSAVGALNTAICYLLFAALVDWCGWHYRLALAADYGFGIVLGYGLHRGSTFADRRHLRGAFGKYALTLALTFIANFVMLDALVRWEMLGPVAAQAIAMSAATLIGYTAQKEWVFRSHDETGQELVADHKGASERRVIETTRRAA